MKICQVPGCNLEATRTSGDHSVCAVHREGDISRAASFVVCEALGCKREATRVMDGVQCCFAHDAGDRSPTIPLVYCAIDGCGQPVSRSGKYCRYHGDRLSTPAEIARRAAIAVLGSLVLFAFGIGPAQTRGVTSATLTTMSAQGGAAITVPAE